MISAVHIEDEPRNIELLESLIKTHCGTMIQLVGSAGNIKDAIVLIRAKKPQLVYLDIELNRGNAFELLEKLSQQDKLNFRVIFITAFNEYAVKAFRYNALDYLLKPIAIHELKEATEKAAIRINQPMAGENILETLRQLKLSLTSQKLGIPVADGIVFINSDEVIRVEAKGSYSIFYLTNKQKITATKSLKDLEHILPETSFLRVHHSWIVNIKYLKKYFRGKNGYMEMDDGSTVMVSIRKKGKFLDSF